MAALRGRAYFAIFIKDGFANEKITRFKEFIL